MNNFSPSNVVPPGIAKAGIESLETKFARGIHTGSLIANTSYSGNPISWPSHPMSMPRFDLNNLPGI